jgi:hypothetical protein
MIDPILLDLPASLQTERLMLRPPQSGDGLLLLEAVTESLPELRRFLASLPWVAGEQTLESSETFCRTAQANFIARMELITDEENSASRKLAERCDFKLEGTLHRERRAPDGALRNTCVYACLAPAPNRP